MQKEHLTPAAILVGSVIIAAGLYFGLQGRGARLEGDDDRPAAPHAAPGAPGATAPAAPPLPAQPAAPAPRAVTGELKAKVEEQVRKELEARRADFVRTCWEPSFKNSPTPPQAKYIFAVSFDPQGKEIARGISEVRGMERSDTARCLRALPMGIEIPPPGAHVGVEIDITLP